MAITFTNLGAQGTTGTATNPDLDNNADTTSYANSSWTPPNTGVILLAVANTKATTVGVAPTISGNGIDWVQIDSAGQDLGAQTHRLTNFIGIATGSTTGQTTADFAGVTQSGCEMSFIHADGVDISGGVAGLVVQSPATNTGVAGTTGTVTFAAAGAVGNRQWVSTYHARPEGKVIEATWTKMDEIYGISPGHGLTTSVQTGTFDTFTSATWVTSDVWFMFGVELKSASSTYEDAVTVAKINAVTIADTIDMPVALTLTKINTVVPAVAIVMDALVAIAKRDGITADSIATMGALLPLGRILAFSASTVTVGTKGYVTVIDFDANPATATSFAASGVDTEDY